MDLTFITGNAAKAAYLADYFDLPIAHRKIDLPEIQSLDLEKIVQAKTEEAFNILGTPVLVEDVSLVFHGLNQLPGPLIKWFYESLGNDGLCRLLDSYSDRSATASVMFGLHDGTRAHFFKGEVRGTISTQPRGDLNFGWDPIFIPDGFEQTWAEMSGKDKHSSSMRRPALEQLRTHLGTVS